MIYCPTNVMVKYTPEETTQHSNTLSQLLCDLYNQQSGEINIGFIVSTNKDQRSFVNTFTYLWYVWYFSIVSDSKQRANIL